MSGRDAREAGARRVGGGALVDTTRPLTFRFDDRVYTGFAGDTLASALLANGVRLLGRSFKYHRPRGLVSAGIEEPNALVQLAGEDDEPNVRASTLMLRDGLVAYSQNRWPTLEHDVGAVNDRLHRLFPAGFYYKTFMGGPGWRLYGRVIRRLAGLGEAPRTVPAHRYEKRFAHTDVLVVGAGPAGLAAALTASRAGARVLLVDESPAPGGQLFESDALIDDRPALEWVTQACEELDANPRVRRLLRTSASGYYEYDFVTLVETGGEDDPFHERVWKVRAGQVVVACGATERPLVFEDNDRPGVMLAHSALAFVRRYGVLPGRRAVVVGCHSAVAADVALLKAHGLDIAAVVDTRAEVEPLPAELADVEHVTAGTVAAVHGRLGVTAAEVASAASPERTRRIGCDLVLMSGGWNPSAHLSSQAGAKPVWDATVAAFVPGPQVQSEHVVGAARGVFDLAGCLADGVAGARAALKALEFKASRAPKFRTAPSPDYVIEPAWRLPGKGEGRAFVDFQNDVTDKDIGLAVRENLVSVEHVKRYTTAGMGTDQGKLANVNTIGLLADALSLAPGEVGTTTWRPPWTPVSFGAITGHETGDLVLPARRTPMTDWIEANGAHMFEAGSNWRRPLGFVRDGETLAEATQREALACRQGVGIYDGTPLGKFELQGPDVVTFLERVTTNRWADLALGQGRFCLMLREDGRLMDDGVVFRLAEHRWWLFCGTGAALHTQMHLERLLTLEWPDLDVFMLPVTAQWANICVCGPLAREVIADAGTDVDLGSAALPFMGLREGHVAGVETRLARVGYTGELSFEMNVPADRALEVWERLMAVGASYGITPVGSDASMVMRCEKGFIAAGYEGDGTANPYDAGLGWAVDETKDDFIGKRSLVRDRNVGGVRQEVVGFETLDPQFVPPDGTPVVDGRERDGLPRVVGYVSQGVMSPNVGRSIAMGLVENGRARLGETVTLAAKDASGPARIVRPCFIDPAGRRMRG